VREWARGFAPGAALLELGCGSGVISEVLIEAGLTLYAVDASPTLLAAFRNRFPALETECATAEESAFFHRTFNGVIAVGLMFLLPEDAQRIVLAKVANVLRPGGKFLFTAPRQMCTWMDALTKRESFSLGAEQYGAMLRGLGLEVAAGCLDEGENYYLFAVKT
jgi:cyclopropane fatty-acyl-phospholipid synthase-like methyltransferase